MFLALYFNKKKKVTCTYLSALTSWCVFAYRYSNNTTKLNESGCTLQSAQRVHWGKWVGCGFWCMLAWLRAEDLRHLQDKTWTQQADLIVWPVGEAVRGLDWLRPHVRARLTDFFAAVTQPSHIHQLQRKKKPYNFRSDTGSWMTCWVAVTVPDTSGVVLLFLLNADQISFFGLSRFTLYIWTFISCFVLFK